MHLGPALEPVAVTLHPALVAPKGLACDAGGSGLFLTDGLSIFAARLARGAEPGSPLQAAFRRAPLCPALLGESVLDMAVVCAPGRGAGCEALLLHRRGQRVARCPMAEADAGTGLPGVTLDSAGRGAQLGVLQRQRRSGAGLGFECAGVSQGWLRRASRDAVPGPSERPAWLLLDPACAGLAQDVTGALLRGCVSLGSTGSRVVRMELRGAPAAEELLPTDVLLEGAAASASRREVPRAFNERYIGALKLHDRSIQLFDAGEGGAHLGQLVLPVPDVSAFCVGGGHVYLLAGGRGPKIWRFPLPTGLRADEV